MFFLKTINTDERKLLGQKLSPYQIDRDAVVFSQGTDADSMFFVEVGTVKIVYKSAEGSGFVETIRVVSQGEFFGEEGVLGENTIRPYSAIAVDAGILYVFTRGDLEMIMSQSPRTGTRILLEISQGYRDTLDEPRMKGKVFVFYGPKDGAGRTTLAVNAAIHLNQATGKPVAFIDADFQFGNAALIAGGAPIPNLAGLIRTESSFIFEQIKGFMPKFHGVDFLWSPEMPQDSELVRRDALRKVIRELRANYPFVVIDGRCEIDENTLLLWDEADRIALIGTADIGFLERAFRLNRLLTTLGYNPQRFVGVLSKLDDSTRHFLEEYKKVLSGPVFTMHFHPETTRQAELAGKPVAIEVPGSQYMREVEILVKGLLGQDVPPPKPGFLAKLAALFTT